MPWTCHKCTFCHDESHMVSYVCCSICNTPRQQQEEVVTIQSSSASDPKAKKAVVIDLTSSPAPTAITTAPKTTTTTTTPQPESQCIPTLNASSSHLSSSSPLISSSSSNVYTITPLEANCYTYFQKDNWSCGYRNLQTLISFLIHLPSVTNSACDYSAALEQGGLAVTIDTSSSSSSSSLTVSSLSTIQHCIKKAWDAGYDPSSSPQEIQHRRRFTSQTNSWIGTPEVVAVLRYVGIPCDIKAWSNNAKEDDRSGWPDGAVNAADCLIHFATVYFCNDDEGNGIKPPLYLQRRGHSITCVGVILPRSSHDSSLTTSTITTITNTSNATILLISDPAVQSGKVKQASSKQLAKFTAWEVGYVSQVNKLLSPGEGKQIECAVFQNIS
uniref:UFSP1/2/DUB catalytic domain-containing protein n=1 Tax=Ditylum brightwellii TaxID=49249 RepID=A0A7S1YRR1_9STRA|mmetsp:Transcript_15622/g.23209  ORF Transcript_15622/g.23209 Transcript_15622/m.23209 type:complete len:386 (+) Transcript_15622:125-1282(+)